MKAAAAGGAGEFWRRKKNFHNLSKQEEASVRIETSLGDGGLEGAEPGEDAQLNWGNVFHHHLSASICINYDSAPSGGADVQTDSEDGETKHSPAVTHKLQNTQTGRQAGGRQSPAARIHRQLGSIRGRGPAGVRRHNSQPDADSAKA